MHNTKSRACMRGLTHHFHSAPRGYEPTSQSSKESMTAPLRIRHNRTSARTPLLVHESVSMPQAHTLGTAFKTGETGQSRWYKNRDANLKSSKESPYHQSLRTTTPHAGIEQPSKDAIRATDTSKDFDGAAA